VTAYPLYGLADCLCQKPDPIADPCGSCQLVEPSGQTRALRQLDHRLEVVEKGWSAYKRRWLGGHQDQMTLTLDA
jgi:hypothetical protein